MPEMCGITLCREAPTRFLLTKDESVFLCATHKARWDFSTEFNRARRQAVALVDMQKERGLAPAAYDRGIRRAWLLAMDDFVRRVSQEERVAQQITREAELDATRGS